MPRVSCWGCLRVLRAPVWPGLCDCQCGTQTISFRPSRAWVVLISPRVDWWHEAQRYCVTCIRSQQVCDFSPSRLDFLPVLSPLCFCQADEGRTFQGKESKERSSWNKLPFLSFYWRFWFTGLSARQTGRRGRTGGDGPSPGKQLTCSGLLSDPFYVNPDVTARMTWDLGRGWETTAAG